MQRLLKRKIMVVVMVLISCAASGQEKDYAAGFKVISVYDSARIYKPESATSDKLHYRPIDIDVWYPAVITPSDTTVSFSDLLNLLEQRSNFYDDTRSYDGLTEEMLQYLCAGTDCADPGIIKKLQTSSYINAGWIEKKFPLVVYLAGLNGMSYENYLMFELLARKGFIVASVSSIGKYPGNMTMDDEDVLEQVKDAEFIISYLTRHNLASHDMSLIGYSWGGLVAAIMAMTDPEKFKAVVSLDGSEQFTYADEDENQKLNRFRTAPFFKPDAITASYLYLDSDISTLDAPPDSIYNIVDHIKRDKCYLKIDHAVHEDFSSLRVVAGESKGKYGVIQQLTVDYLLNKTKGASGFCSSISTEGITKQFSQPVLLAATETSGRKTLKGFVMDGKSNLPLSYVNIGIPNKDVGTTSNAKGEFELTLSEENSTDTLRVSMVGYGVKMIPLADVFKKQKPVLNIRLQEEPSALNEVVITSGQLTTKVVGNKTDSKFFGGKFASGDLGSEIAIRIRVKDAPTYLEAFSFNISYNSADTATFRVNVYEEKNKLPGKNILTGNIILKINGQTGKLDVDLSKYNIAVQDDFFIGLEWIEGKDNSGIVFSAGFMNKGTYYRKASQGRWKKYPMGVGFNVTAKY